MASIIKVDTIQTAAGGTPTAADLGIGGTGKVLQVVEASTYTRVSTTSSSQTDTGISATITPSSTSSKILIQACTTLGTSAANTYISCRFYRGSTDLGYLSDLLAYDSSSGPITEQVNFCQLDSPNTTSATTYKLTFGNQGGSGTAFANTDAGSATEHGRGQIILMEIAG